jgi:magnesium chelatase family protein
MPLARTRAVTLHGIHAQIVEVEADLTSGVVGLHLVGLPDAALSESRDRVRSAVINSGYGWPNRRITVNLLPASLPKRGSGLDLAIGIAILGAAGIVPPQSCAAMILLGELGLDGRIRPVHGVLPAALAAADAGCTEIAVTPANHAEAELVPDLKVIPVASLAALVARLRDEPPPPEDDDAGVVEAPPELPSSARAGRPSPHGGDLDLDLSDVRGQPMARMALEVSAAGGHHLMLLGPPGCGKTMLAERLPTLLPPLDRKVALEVTAIHSVAGRLPPDGPLVTRPPYCAPHHTASRAAMVGGGSGVPRPGAASLAHRGVLFLDEAPEFGPGVLDSLRQPLEDGWVTIARASTSARFPARFTLVLAANPCPCAAAHDRDCTCTPMQKRRYLGRLSGPLLDRIDLKTHLRRVSRAELRYDLVFSESSAVVAQRVLEARARATARLADTPWRTNAEVPGRELRHRFTPGRGALDFLDGRLGVGALTARGIDRIVRVMWTLADLAGHDAPDEAEAVTAYGMWEGRTA